MFKPLGNRILVEKILEENITKSGIILKDTSTKSDIEKANVVEISEKIEDIKVGDKIYFSKYKGDNINIDDKEYIILDIEDVLGREY